MHALTASDVLTAWERGRGRRLDEVALELLAATGEARAPDELAIGDRNALLLELRLRAFGPWLAATAACPACGERLDVELDGRSLAAAHRPARRDPVSVATDEGVVHVRPPTAGDLRAAAATGSVAAGRAELLRRCVAGRDGAALSPEALRAVGDRLAEADPAADVDLALTCPACAHEFTMAFDIVAFLWAEVDARARRLLREVHALATAYGWTEPEVLTLSPERRAAYLELIAA